MARTRETRPDDPSGAPPMIPEALTRMNAAEEARLAMMERELTARMDRVRATTVGGEVPPEEADEIAMSVRARAPANAGRILTRGAHRFLVCHGAVGRFPKGTLVEEEQLGDCDLDRLLDLGALRPIPKDDPDGVLRYELERLATFG